MLIDKKQFKQFAATGASAALVATAVAPAAMANDEAVQTAAFTDVAPQYKDAVDYLIGNNIAKGVTETQFGVNATIKRGDAAIILANALELNDPDAPVSGFSDVPDRGARAINSLKAAGVVNGKTDTNFGFHDMITRGEMALLLARAGAYDLEGDVESLPFTDVNDRYDEAVAGLVEAGITNGINDNQFGTNQNIKRGDFAVFIHRAETMGMEAESIVDSVTSISTTGVTVQLVDGFEGAEGVTIEVTNPSGERVAVDAKTLAGNEESVIFNFAQPLTEVEVGTWIVDGEEFTVTSEIVAAVNEADTAEELAAALALLNNDDFDELSDASQAEVVERFTTARGDTVYTQVSQIETALAGVLTAYAALLAGVNEAESAAELETALGELGNDVFDDLSDADQTALATAFFAEMDEDTPFTSLADINRAILRAGNIGEPVTGVENDEVYFSEVAPTFIGTATLNGEAYTSGTEIDEDGEYTLVVTSEAGVTTTIVFEVVIIDSAAELTRALGTDEETVTLGGNITDADGTAIVVSDTVTLDGANFSVDGPIEIGAEADGTAISNIEVTAGTVSGGETSGFYVGADDVVLDNVGVNGPGAGAANGIDTTVGEKTITVTNSEFNNLLRGINLNYNDLIATGNSFANVAYGVAGTEDSEIQVTGNTFTTGTEGIGLGEGVTVIGAEAGNEVAYLEGNNRFQNVATRVADYRPAEEE